MQIDLRLTQECGRCSGMGKIYSRAYQKGLPAEDCPECQQGEVPTELGANLLDFLRQHLEPECFIKGNK